MKIILEQNDLDQAIYQYVESMGVSLEGKEVNMTFTAGRGANGNTVTVDIDPIGTNKQIEMNLDRDDSAQDAEAIEEDLDPNSELFG